MNHWNKLTPSPYNPDCPLPKDSQVWEIGIARSEAVVGVPGSAARQLTDAQHQEERVAEQLRRLGEVRPGQSLPQVKRR
jgi:hypothetical protein